MLRNILICFIVALPIIYGLQYTEHKTRIDCWSLAKDDFEYWKLRALKGDITAAQMLLYSFSDPSSKFYSQKDALFWFFYLGEDFKPSRKETKYSTLTRGMKEADIRAINMLAARWQPEKSPNPFLFTKHRCPIICTQEEPMQELLHVGFTSMENLMFVAILSFTKLVVFLLQLVIYL